MVTVWDPKAGKILRQLKGHTDTVKRVAFSPQEQDNGVAVLASAGGYRCNLWNSKLNNNHLVPPHTHNTRAFPNTHAHVHTHTHTHRETQRTPPSHIVFVINHFHPTVAFPRRNSQRTAPVAALVRHFIIINYNTNQPFPSCIPH